MNLSELLCNEEVAELCEVTTMDYTLEVKGEVDPVLLKDTRVVNNMLADEQDAGKVDYCTEVQTEIKPHMRKIVVDWMVEVCEDAECQPHVYHLAVNYLDRYLSQVNLEKKYFQSVSAGCLLLASKMVEVRPISSEKLSLYTDHSVGVLELRDWEMKILNVLQWQLSAVTVQTFLDHFAVSAPAKVRRHAEILAATAATEYKFILIRPSLLAAAALSAACRGLNVHYAVPAVLSSQSTQVHILVDHLEYILQSHSSYSTPSTPSQPKQQQYQQTPKPSGTLTPTDCHQVSALVGA